MEEKQPPPQTMQDKRRRRRTVQAIRESEEWLFTTLQSIGDAVIATDVNGFIVFMNPIAVQLTGWSEAEAQGRDCQEVFRIISQTTRLEVESPVNKVMRSGVVSGLANHTILISRDGVEHSIDDSGSPIRNAAGKMVGIVLIFRDVTERRRAEKMLSEQQEILQTLFDHIPLLVAFLDAEGRFRWVNREWSRVMGHSAPQMRQHTQEGELALWIRPGWHEVHILGQAGRLLHISWASVRLSDGSHIGIGQDITERKHQDFEIQARNRRLEQAVNETDHRVKNNFQSIAALLDLQVLANEESIPVQDLTQVRMHIRTLASIHEILVQDVTDHSRAGIMAVRETLEKLLPLLQKAVGKKKIEWSVEEVRLSVKQGISLAVLVNELVCNAVKHGGQQVEVRLAVVEEHVLLEVCDNGPGFLQPFDPKKAASFGLEMVESVGRLDLGGRTTYENRPGGGACVQVSFPLPLIKQA